MRLTAVFLFSILAINAQPSCQALGQLNAENAAIQKLKSIEKRILDLVPKLKPCIVCIQAPGGGSGSGVIVSADGLILTAAHVVDKQKELTIVFPDGRKLKGEALGSYGPADAAMAKLVEGGPFPYTGVSSGRDLEVDQTVIALGHPGGFDLQRGPPLRIGHIVKIEENFIEVDASLIGGDSGGPSFDLDGNVIGIHSHISGSIAVNRDAHIAQYHPHWEAMESGHNHEQHYSKAVKPTPDDEETDPQKPTINPSPAPVPNVNGEKSKLQQLAEQAKESGGKIKLSKEELKQLRLGLAKRTDDLAPPGGTRLQDTWAEIWNSGASDALSTTTPLIVYVQVDGRRVANATCVHRDGWFITKASEVKNREVRLELANGEFREATIEALDESLDLALLLSKNYRGQCIDLTLAKSREDMPMGTLCFALNASSKLAGFGAISVVARPLNGKTGAYVGVALDAKGGKLRVQAISPGSPANKSGLKLEDRILSIDGVTVTTDEEFQKLVQSHVEGETIRLDVERGDNQLTVPVKLADGSHVIKMPGAREQAMDSMTAMLSKRRWGFARGIQHDCAISSKDVGGPLVDLENNIVGINIARAGRIHSYAIPIYDVITFLKKAERFELP